jgi:hypothetical protein
MRIQTWWMHAGRRSPSGIYFAMLTIDGRRVAERRIVRLL